MQPLPVGIGRVFLLLVSFPGRESVPLPGCGAVLMVGAVRLAARILGQSGEGSLWAVTHISECGSPLNLPIR